MTAIDDTGARARQILEQAGVDIGAEQETAEADFWTARPIHAHIREFARARMASPWATLGSVLIRATAVAPPEVVLPAIVGGHASLNQFLALVGHSGAGKDAAEAAARDAVKFGHILELPLGSGEGIVKTYVRSIEDDDGVRMDQYNDTALFTASEVDKVAAIAGRNGSTLTAVLRDAWTGKMLGFANSEIKRRIWVNEHHYRMCLIVGVQPGRGHALLNADEVAGGTPQRFVWLPATDPAAPDVEPAESEPWEWTEPAGLLGGFAPAGLRRPIPVWDGAVHIIRDARRARLRGQETGADGHALLCRLKIAAALGLLDGHLGVTEEDWDLAGVVMVVSGRTRDEVAAVLAEDSARSNRAKGDAEAERAVRVEEGKEERAARKTADRIVTVLGRANTGEWMTHKNLRNAAGQGYAGLLTEAAERLEKVGRIEVERFEYRGTPGVRYRLVQDHSQGGRG